MKEQPKNATRDLMSRRAWCTFVTILFLRSAYPADIATHATYTGPIASVAPGFFGLIGVGLPSGQTCHGQNVVVLQATNSMYKEVMAVLMTSIATGQIVKFYDLGSQTVSFYSGAYTFCVIAEASIGEFSMWP